MKRVYFFGPGGAEGDRAMKTLLGGKGANLAEMTNLGVPVPPGFTIACDVCVQYLRTGAAQASVTAVFDVPSTHPACAHAAAQGIAIESELILRITSTSFAASVRAGS